MDVEAKGIALVGRVWSTSVLRIVCVCIGLVGMVLVAGGLPGSGTTDWPIDVVGPGAGLLAAALAGLVALRGVQSWREKQAEHAATATRENRSRVYENVLAHMISSFAGGAPLANEPTVRAMAAAWASNETLGALADWFRYAGVNSGKPNPNRTHSYELVYRVIAAMRLDVDPDSEVSKDDVLRMIFNDYVPLEHNPDGVGKIAVDAAGNVTNP